MSASESENRLVDDCVIIVTDTRWQKLGDVWIQKEILRKEISFEDYQHEDKGLAMLREKFPESRFHITFRYFRSSNYGVKS